MKQIYTEGQLMVTSVLLGDLKEMHDTTASAAVGKHATSVKIIVTAEDLKSGGALSHAKANWTLTSPNMTPHYFGMMDDTDHTPKTQGLFASPASAPRVATLADPAAMGKRFMRGKTAREDFSDWSKDQASGKAAGVANAEPLFDFDDKAVSRRFAAIKKQQETVYGSKNPEINTFGFPPDAAVGFLVASPSALNATELAKTKAAMSPEQQVRSFPVFTCKSTGKETWTLVLLGHA